MLDIRLHAVETAATPAPEVAIAYKSPRITTRVPVLTITTRAGLFSDPTLSILLEAHDRQGNVVGQPKPGGLVNPANLTVSLPVGDSVKVTLKMDPEFEGKFTVKALDPSTFTIFSQLKLETDYLG